MPAMEITTIIGCKMSCTYCPQDRFVKAYTKRSDCLKMSFDTFKTYLDKIPLYVDIIFSGMSEPWLNPDCTKMLLYAHNRGHKIIADTTLVGMNLSDIDMLATIPFRHFVVHLPSVEGYEKIEVNEGYLNLLDKIYKSNTKIRYHFYRKRVHPKIEPLIKKDIYRIHPYTRSGNVKIEGRPFRKKRRGVIGCERDLRWNILLPNGDVILCSNDYGMQHILGNLNTSDYESLFRSEEFLKIEKSLRDESLDILCRYCDMYAYNVSLFAKIYNPLYYRYKDVI